jgi:hypothetical protein
VKEPALPRYLKRIWRDQRIPYAAFILLLEMKALAKLDVLRISMGRLAKLMRCSVKTIERHIGLLAKLRVIIIRHNSERGNLSSSTYILDDVRFAKFLSEAARPKKAKSRSVKNVGGVPSVLHTIPETQFDAEPDNVVHMPEQGKAKCRL